MRIPKVKRPNGPVRVPTNKTPIFQPKISPKIKTTWPSASQMIRSCRA